ncbi:MAG: winged helix-turn-helix transcriptional regulator [Methanobacteriota archaeon]|nr:MAG: winged helix-turn-helix transcriptional regulator [Euryarchaeota archaeon]
MGLRRMRYIQLALSALLLLATALYALPSVKAPDPTYVGGSVSGVWDAGTYIAVENVMIPLGETLVIGPGVEVRFNEPFGLVVHGSLIVDGTEGDPVVFTSNSTDKFPGDWHGITITETSEENHIDNARIEYAMRGIYCTNGASFSIQYSEIKNNSLAGVDLVSCSGTISHSRLTGNNVGIKADSSEIDVIWSQILQNTDYSMALWNSHVHMESTTISDSFDGIYSIGSTLGLFNSTIASENTALHLADVSSAVSLNTYFNKERVVFDGLPSTLLIEWFLDLRVQDMHSSGVLGASVGVKPTQLEQIDFLTGEEGWIETVVVKEITMTSLGEESYNPYQLSASREGYEVNEEVIITESTTVHLTLAADLIAPTAYAGEDMVVDEDTTVDFDASFSEDNDPDFLTTGSFYWTFYDYGGSSHAEGLEPWKVYLTPGSYSVRLRVEDAFGNWDEDYMIVEVRDITNPIANASFPASIQLGDTATLDATSSKDNDPDFSERGNYTWRFNDGSEDVVLYGDIVDCQFPHAGTYSIELTVRDPTGNADTYSADIQVLELPEDFNYLPFIAIGIAMLALAGAASTEAGKFWFFKVLLIPLYVKLSKKDILDHFIRGEIYGYIKVHPGDNYTTIKQNLNLKNGTLTYHLDVLEREGLVKSQLRGSRRHYYAKEARMPDDGTGFPAIKNDIITRIQETPGITMSDLAALIGVSRQLANYHVRGLIQEGYIRTERKGMKTRCYLNERKPGF